MKKLFFLACLFLLTQCGVPQQTSFGKPLKLSKDFKTYWFDGTAEISAYQLKKSRYGELREGQATLIYVTEDFLEDAQVKANTRSRSSYPVLKLNRNTAFLTGIYPYNIMSSSFTRLGFSEPLVKISTSVQEWCGQAYLQLNRRGNFAIKSHSYFEGEADQDITTAPVLTEDELWHLIRTQPDQLPLDEQLILPSMEYLRLHHQPLVPQKAVCSLQKGEEETSYTINYPKLGRTLSINFRNEAPHLVESWEEKEGENSNNHSSAQRIKTLKLPYWKLNQLGDEHFRDSLGLK